MRVLIVEPGQYPREADIDGSLDTLQHIVGGLIETLYPWEDRAVLICNDEGKLMGLPLNRSLEDYDIIAGTLRRRLPKLPARRCAPLRHGSARAALRCCL